MSIFKKSGKKRNKRPEICLSLNCKNTDEIKQELSRYADYCTIVEWCVDAFDGAAELTEEEFVSQLLAV